MLEGIIITVTSPGRQPLSVLLFDRLVIGREADGLIVPVPEVSRRHVEFRRLGEVVEVTDLGSTNGTVINGAALVGTTQVHSASLLEIGDTKISIEFPDSAVPGLGRTTEVREMDPGRTSIDAVAEEVSSRPLKTTQRDRNGDTVTILFSDIESSTERAAQLGDVAWYQLLEIHNRIFRSALVEVGGREVKSMGDGFMLTFPSVRKALTFASRVQNKIEAEDGPDLRVRMGLHTGEALVGDDGDIFGRHVIMAARVANLAAGGEVLASLVVNLIAAGDDA
ncbi:MAG: adenylate/guanylate cyclase domain-containing protein, partial [Actinomycetota bacterium]